MRKFSSLTLPWPTDWHALFGAAHPLIVEIGFGYATYLIALAQHNPDANVVGIEIVNECLVRGEKAVYRLNLTNVRIVHSRAETALHHLFEPASVSQFHINFPDPWFKQRHERRRLMQRPTLDALVSRLETGGRLYLATDILEYAEMCAELFAHTPGLENTLPTPWANAMPGRVTTKYESKAQAVGRACYYFAYRRNAQPAPDVPVIKDLDMPHMVFHSPLSLDAMYRQFQPMHQEFGDIHVNVLEAFQNERNLLFEVYVKEPTIDQRVAILLVYHPQTEEYTLKLGALGHPRPTLGIHRAVSLLGDWLLSLHPDNRMLKRSLASED